MTQDTIHLTARITDEQLREWVEKEIESFNGNTSEMLRYHLRQRAQLYEGRVSGSHVERAPVEEAFNALNSVDMDASTPMLVTAIDRAQEALAEVLLEK